LSDIDFVDLHSASASRGASKRCALAKGTLHGRYAGCLSGTTAHSPGCPSILCCTPLAPSGGRKLRPRDYQCRGALLRDPTRPRKRQPHRKNIKKEQAHSPPPPHTHTHTHSLGCPSILCCTPLAPAKVPLGAPQSASTLIKVPAIDTIRRGALLSLN
jgi:hypothetical protein